MKDRNMPNTISIALIAVFAALYTVLGFVPLFYIFGAYGQFITASLILAPIIGIILGPVGGTLATIIGGIAGMYLTGNMPMGIFSFIPGVMDTLCVGLIFRKKWYISALIFGILIISFAMLPSIGEAKYYVWFHTIALLTLLSPASNLSVDFIKSDDPQKIFLGVSILVFIGVLIDHITGSLLFQLLSPLPPQVWEGMAFVYPVERLLVTVLATIIGAGVVKAVLVSGLKIGKGLI